MGLYKEAGKAGIAGLKEMFAPLSKNQLKRVMKEGDLLRNRPPREASTPLRQGLGSLTNKPLINAHGLSKVDPSIMSRTPNNAPTYEVMDRKLEEGFTDLNAMKQSSYETGVVNKFEIQHPEPKHMIDSYMARNARKDQIPGHLAGKKTRYLVSTDEGIHVDNAPANDLHYLDTVSDDVSSYKFAGDPLTTPIDEYAEKMRVINMARADHPKDFAAAKFGEELAGKGGITARARVTHGGPGDQSLYLVQVQSQLPNRWNKMMTAITNGEKKQQVIYDKFHSILSPEGKTRFGKSTDDFKMFLDKMSDESTKVGNLKARSVNASGAPEHVRLYKEHQAANKKLQNKLDNYFGEWPEIESSDPAQMLKNLKSSKNATKERYDWMNAMAGNRESVGLDNLESAKLMANQYADNGIRRVVRTALSEAVGDPSVHRFRFATSNNVLKNTGTTNEIARLMLEAGEDKALQKIAKSKADTALRLYDNRIPHEIFKLFKDMDLLDGAAYKKVCWY